MNGIRLYHEIYGQSEPLVLIHGGLTMIGETQGWVRPLAKRRRVIAVAVQAHGPYSGHRSADELHGDGRRQRLHRTLALNL